MASQNKQEHFINDLVQFYRNRGISSANSSQFVAKLNGKNVNLFELYSSVLELGGSYKVNQANLWDEIYFKLFKANYVGANFAVALRQIYNRYLLQYEKSCSGNFNSEQWSNDNDDDDENAIFSNSHSASLQYSNQLYNSNKRRDLNSVIDSNGQIHNNSKLYCSLLSGLPNELNYAFSVATILSNRHRFDWTNDYKFINVLLESIKSYCCVCDYFDELLIFGKDTFTDNDEIEKLEKLIRNSFPESFINFDNITRKPNKPNGIIHDSTESLKMPNFNKKIDFIEHKCDCYLQFWNRICLDESLIEIIFNDGSSDEIDLDSSILFKDFPQNLFKKVEERITLIADLIRNISFTYNQNNQNHVSMTPLIKFLTLMLRSDNVKFVNISLDILSNIAPSMSFHFSKRIEDEYVKLLQILFKNIVDIAMNSNNIHDTTKSFEIMARYITPNKHEANLLLEKNFKNDKIYERITQLLTCHYDISLVLALLEFCLVLSECRPHILVNNGSKTFLKILVNLLNCHIAQHFTTGALEKIKIIDTRPVENVVSSDSGGSHNKIIPPRSIQQNSINIIVNNSQINSTPITINTNQQIQMNFDILDNESFAINWLKTTYEEVPSKCSLQINDIYAEYVKHCCRNSRRNVIAAQSFNFLLKRCFPVCNINQAIVEGLMLRNQTITKQEDQIIKKQTIGTPPNNTTASQMSPILKAHLSTPPKTQLVLNESVTPTGSLTTTPTNASTFIKSLLANKLRNNQQIVSAQPPNSTPTAQVVLTNQSNELPKPQDNNIQQQQQQKQNIIISNNNVLQHNPATSFALTPTMFSNNIIVPTSIQSSVGVSNQLPGSQQIFLVRTIITAPGQQQTSSPVRLLVPASMITQTPARLPTPNINGMAANPSLTVTNPTSMAPILQSPQIITNSSNTQNIVSNTVPVIVSASTANQAPQPQVVHSPMKSSSIANSSPLLNVLLDKGKLPDFPNQNSTTQTITNPDPLINSKTSGQNSIVQSQPKVFFLAPNTSQPPQPMINNNNNNNSIVTASIDSSKSNLAITETNNPVVNGDMKTPVKSNASSKTTPKPKKRLKSNSTDNSPTPKVNTMVKNNDEKIETNVSNNNTSDASTVVAPILNKSAIDSKSNTTINNTQPTNQVVNPTVSPNQTVNNNSQQVILEFECQWNDCRTKFTRPSDVFYHVHSRHIMTDYCPNFMNCLWGGSEGKGPGCLSKRPKLSLLTHLQDFHCNPTILKQEAVRKKQLELVGASNIVVPQPPAHPGYAQNAAMLAIRRHNDKKIESEPVTPMTPLTVSIRLTSALILRNLAKRSHLFKKSLESFESNLCEISAAEGREESRTIAQCLAVLNENK